MRYEIEKVLGRKGAAVILSLLLLCGIGSCYFKEDIQESVPQKEYAENYSSDLVRLIRTAERNKSNLEKGSYLYKYQDRIIETYEALLAAQWTPGSVSGYDKDILFEGKSIFLLIAASVFGSLLALVERDYGMTALLAISKRGKAAYRNKAAAACFMATAGTVFSSAAQLAVFLLRFGAEGLFAPLASISAFAFCPYCLTVFEYLLIRTGALSLFASSVTLAACLAGRFSGSYVLAIFAGLIPSGVFFFGGNGFSSLFSRYRALNIGGTPVFLGNVAAAVLLFAFAGLVFLMHVAPVRVSSANAAGKVERGVILWLGRKTECIAELFPRQNRRKRQTLFYYELKKLSVASLMIVLLLFGLKCHTLLQMKNTNSLYDEMYFNICKELSGELTTEKEAFIGNSLAAAEKTVSEHEEMREKLMAGAISRAEYEEYLERFSRADIDVYLFNRLETKADEILELRKEGKDAFLVYDTGWNLLLFEGYDLYLYLSVLFLLAGLFGIERKCGMEPMLRTAKNGTGELTLIKIIFALSLTAFVYVVFETCDLISVTAHYALPGWNYPAASLSGVSSSIDTSIALFAILSFAGKLAGYLLFCVVICLVSWIFRREYYVIPAVLTITFLPHFLADVLPVRLDFLNLLA